LSVTTEAFFSLVPFCGFVFFQTTSYSDTPLGVWKVVPLKP